MLLGMSQAQVAERLNLTFQQVQKYEKGTNRIGASRLNLLGEILGVPVSYFYEGAPRPRGAKPSRKRPADAIGVSDIAGFLATKKGLRLMTAFLQIKNETLRRRLIAFVVAVARSQSDPRKVIRSRVG